MADIVISYTSTDQIRSVLGLDEADIMDELLVAQNLEIRIRLALEKCIPDYLTLLAAKPEMADALKVWAMWYGAVQVANSPLSIAKKLTTGKDAWVRFDVDWEHLRVHATEQLRLAKKCLKEVAGIKEEASLVFPGVGKAAPAYDPITGRGPCDRAQLTERKSCI